MKKRALILVLICITLVFAIALAGCGSKKPGVPDETGEETQITPGGEQTPEEEIGGEQTPEETEKPTATKTVIASQQTIGCGGYGAVFNAKIDPYNENYFGATCDMGSAYFSFDTGESWIRHNIQGTLYCLEYDPSAEGVVWVAGSGIYKSVDHGRTMKMVFPKPEQVVYEGNNYENANYWIYTDKQSDYAPHYQIWSMAVNRKSGGKNVFAGQRVASAGLGYSKCIRIYQTTDGESFSLFKEMPFSDNYKLDYDESNDCLIFATPEAIYEINAAGDVYTIDQPVFVQFQHGNNMCFESSYDPASGRNTFVFSARKDGEHAATACYKTNDLRDKSSYVDLTEELCALTVEDLGLKDLPSYNAGQPSYKYCEWISGKTVLQEFKWTITDVSVLNDDVVYLFHEANTDTVDKDGNLYIKRRTMIYLKYDAKKPEDERFKYVFGFPHKPYNKSIENYGWQDRDSDYCFGMTSFPKNDDALLYCSNVGVYYTADGETVKQLNSLIFGSDEVTMTDPTGKSEAKKLQRMVTTGVDVVCTQTVATDPFDPKHILMGCTDIGLLQSYDDSESWYHSLYEWQDGVLKNIDYAQYTNTCFELHFDRERQGVVYSIWSLAKTAPYNAGSTYLGSPARFGISYDGGLSWTMKNITPDGKCLPYRMQVVYKGSEREIYIATDSNGFFVTRDLGETFTAMNDGLDVATVNGVSAIWGNEILVCEAGTFALTGGSATDPTYQMLYKWNEELNKFEKIGLPTTEYNGKTYTPAAIRDMVYDEREKCLYLAATANVVRNYSVLEKTAGGIWKYKDGEFTQIYDDKISVFGVNIDGSGRLYATELNGRLIRFDNDNTEWEIFVDGMFHRLKGICFGLTDDIIYVPTWGGNTEKIVLAEVPVTEEE